MSVNRTIFERLASFYDELNRHLIPVEGDVCKACQCNDCCTFAARGGEHFVSEMEMDYIEEFYRKKGYPRGSINLFKEYLARKKAQNGEILHQICPFYDTAAQGCSIYPARPLSCRLYGSYFTEGFRPPQRCHYLNKGKVLGKNQFLAEVPVGLEFMEVKMEYQVMRPLTYTGEPMPQLWQQGMDDLTVIEGDEDAFGRAFKLDLGGRKEEALAEYTEARAKYPRWSFIPYLMGNIFMMLNRFDEAVAHYEEAVTLRPTNPFFRFMLAYAYDLTRNVQKAIEEYEEAVKLNPENALACGSLANLLKDEGRLVESLEHYKKALEIDPDYAIHQVYCGVVLFDLQRPKEAEPYLARALELDPNLALAALYLGRVRQALGDDQAAQTYFIRALELSKVSQGQWEQLAQGTIS